MLIESIPSALVIFCFVHFNEKKTLYVPRNCESMDFLVGYLEEKYVYIGLF